MEQTLENKINPAENQPKELNLRHFLSKERRLSI